MKKTVIILLAVLFGNSLLSLSQDNSGTLVIYREFQMQASNFYYPVMINNEKVVDIKTGTVFIKNLEPGTYKISAKTENEAAVDVIILPNDTAYVRCGVNMGIWAPRPDVIQVDKKSAKAAISSAPFRNISHIVYKEFIQKGSIGIIIGSNFGFENFDVFMMENGNYSTLSTGGSFSIGAIISHKIHKNFEMSYDLRYQGASLSPNLSNASAHFGKGTGYVSVYAIQPFKNEVMQMKFGGGLGYHFGCNMEIDGKKIGEGLITANYKSAMAYRLGSVFETRMNKMAFSIGLHYTGVNYEIAEAKYNSMPITFTDRKLKTPNGSNLELSIGYHALF